MIIQRQVNYSFNKAKKHHKLTCCAILLPFVKIWVSKLKKRKAFTLYMISNDKNTSYSTDLCLLKKKLNVHGKYKFNYVHYVIDETNWEWNIDQVKSQNQ
ncbi:hypothetical protein HYE20_03635 [Mycoplasmopsis bovis]|nr:hypothetical protein HYE20_03635 [Mycoplasmopsis bovis]